MEAASEDGGSRGCTRQSSPAAPAPAADNADTALADDNAVVVVPVGVPASAVCGDGGVAPVSARAEGCPVGPPRAVMNIKQQQHPGNPESASQS